VDYSSPKEKSVNGTEHVALFLLVYPQGDLMYSPGLIPGGDSGQGGVKNGRRDLAQSSTMDVVTSMSGCISTNVNQH
jgi:hypothetical protein